MAEEAPRRLGRGLAALIGEAGDDEAVMTRAKGGQRLVPIEFLRPNPRNPRKDFAEADLEELAGSIREKGILQPILVRQNPMLADAYEIIAGERRWRAAQRAGLHEVPVLVIEAGDRESLEIAIIENVQRHDLNALEEAGGYERLIAEFDYAQADLARMLGKSRSHVANTLRLLKLPDSVKALLQEGKLSAGHARALLAVADPHAVAARIVEDGLTVRDVERLGQEAAGKEPASSRVSKSAEKDADTVALERALETVLGLRVAIKHKGESGQVTIAYQSLEQLEALCQRLKGVA